MKNPLVAISTDSELKVIEDACREASGMVEPCELRVSAGA